MITNYNQRSIDENLIIAVFKIANVFVQVPFISDSLKVIDIMQFIRKNIENDNMFPCLPLITSRGKLTKNKRKREQQDVKQTNNMTLETSYYLNSAFRTIYSTTPV